MNIKTKQQRGNLRIFLSYSAADTQNAHKLQRLLSQRSDVNVFSTEMLSAGEDWQTKLKKELSKCDVFLVVLSPNSLDSKWVLQELGAAWAMDKPILVNGTHIDLLSKIPVSINESQFLNIDEIEKPDKLNEFLAPYEKIHIQTTD
ncbi:MAG: toll/interleukin-1 receptor domain-containing protein [bacterium]